jgi:deoxyribodipyrimidine photo-lyase
MDRAPAIVWLRQDLRLGDNPALHAAAATSRPLVLVYILDDETPARWRIGAASRWWLHKSLEALGREIEKRRGRLLLRRGRAEDILSKLVHEIGAAAVFWNRCYEPYAVRRDEALKQSLAAAGVEVKSFNGALLNEPWTVSTKSGEPFKVFTPYWRACQQMEARAPLPAPKRLESYAGDLACEALASWGLPPTKPNWAQGFEPLWTPGEAGAHTRLKHFVEEKLHAYADARDQLGEDGTSRLSPHLHWGEISPVQARAAIEAAAAQDPSLLRGAEKFLAELGWREFSYSLLFHWPALPERNWRASFDAFPWREDEKALDAWRRGRTGYPVVDAAMRELWAAGAMHNRARMIAASFLIKHLLIDWRRGEDWFWDTLLDADLASNAASWQWVAGSGADAAPYFRIFNPVAQGGRYDADGAYVRRWVPELARLPNDVIHRPWEADTRVLREAGVELGRSYPRPIVDHAAARARALAAFATLSSDR